MSFDTIRNIKFEDANEKNRRPTETEINVLNDLLRNRQVRNPNLQPPLQPGPTPLYVPPNNGGNGNNGNNGVGDQLKTDNAGLVSDVKRFLLLAVTFFLFASDWFDKFLQAVFPTTEYVALAIKAVAYASTIAILRLLNWI